MTVTKEMIEDYARIRVEAALYVIADEEPSERRRIEFSEAIDKAEATIDAALTAAPQAVGVPQCCMCGKKDLSTVEGDGGTECELSDGRWVCSAECWERTTEQPVKLATVYAGSDIAVLLGLTKDTDLYTFSLTPPPAQAVGVPDGWKLVPVEPTEAMKEAMAKKQLSFLDAAFGWEKDFLWNIPKDGGALCDSPELLKEADGVYRTMLAATPTPPADDLKAENERKPLDLNISQEWFEKRAAQEGDLEISAGRRKTMTVDLTPDEIAELEKLLPRSEEVAALKAENERLKRKLDRLVIKFSDEQARATAAEARITELEAENERLAASVRFTLSDGSRLLQRSDVEDICPTPDDCFCYGPTVRCGPCTVAHSKANGVEISKYTATIPEVARLKRRIAELEASEKRMREALYARAFMTVEAHNGRGKVVIDFDKLTDAHRFVDSLASVKKEMGND